jgi:hypothetical protein
MRTLAGALAAVAIAIPIAACGSSKPDYCKTKDTLKSNIQALPNKLKSEGVGSLESNLKQIQTDAENLVSSAKGDFPNETKAISNSVNALKTSVTGLGSSPSAQSLLAIVPQAQGVVSSVQAFDKASSSKCS